MQPRTLSANRSFRCFNQGDRVVMFIGLFPLLRHSLAKQAPAIIIFSLTVWFPFPPCTQPLFLSAATQRSTSPENFHVFLANFIKDCYVGNSRPPIPLSSRLARILATGSMFEPHVKSKWGDGQSAGLLYRVRGGCWRGGCFFGESERRSPSTGLHPPANACISDPLVKSTILDVTPCFQRIHAILDPDGRASIVPGVCYSGRQ